MLDNVTEGQLRAAAADLWVEGGVKNITHGKLEKATGKQKGHIAHYWKTSADLVRAAAEELTESGPIDYKELLLIMKGTAPAPVSGVLASSHRGELIATGEALLWLARYPE